ncbi:MAG: hypothetical protein J5717_01940 [Lachnospiraceae bacterium]|nr:hypothetical protein [Lachnospiraceae bacterium]
MGNTAVITYIDENYMENLKIDFLGSLSEKAHYSGKVIVIDYSDSDELVEEDFPKLDIEVVRCKKILPVYTQRYWDIWKVISKLPDTITQILVVDGGDVWFQKSIDGIFEHTINRIGCVEEIQVIGDDEWTDKCVANLTDTTRMALLKKCSGTHVKNSGLLCGPRNLVFSLIKKVYDDIVNEGINFFGIDQLFVNYRFTDIPEEEKCILPMSYNFVLVTNKNGFKIENDIVTTIDGETVTVVHNAGGAWRVLQRPFKNKHMNQEQYFVENVELI